MSGDFAQLKAGMKAAWMAGDFGQIAAYSAKSAEEFVERTSIIRGTRVLDVACGTGNVAIPAARAGAVVTGIDIAPNLLAQARARASGEQLQIQFHEGDAECLPYPDASFDVVLTMFGAMFAPRPEQVAAELLRVCRPGGLIAMANWTPEGFVGKTFQLTAKLAPPPPGVPAPVLWGDEDTVRQRFSKEVSEPEFDAGKGIVRLSVSSRRSSGFFPPILRSDADGLQTAGSRRPSRTGFTA